MRLHHLTTETTDPAERGDAIGRAYGGFVRQGADRYLAHFDALRIPAERIREIVERSRDSLLAWHPALVVESDATASAAGIEPWRAFAVAARTEVLAVAPSAGEGECSTVVRVPADGGAPETIQTWDWHDHLATDGLLHRLTAASGRAVKLFTEFGAAAKIGVNDAGLGTSTSCRIVPTATRAAFPCTGSRDASSRRRRRSTRPAASRHPLG